MTPESPKNPREALETRLTALLLGELNPAEAATLREVIQHDAALATLHDRLKRTIELVRETAIATADQPAEEPAPPVQLSTERRQSLLAHFKTSIPLPSVQRPRQQVRWYFPAALAACVVVLAVGTMVTGILTPTFMLSDKVGDERAAVKAWGFRRSEPSVVTALPQAQLRDNATLTKPSAGKEVQVYLPPGVVSEGETEFAVLPESSRQTTKLSFGFGGATAGGGFGGGGGGGGVGGQLAAAGTPFVGEPGWVGVLEKPSDGKQHSFALRQADVAPPVATMPPPPATEQPATVDPTTGLPVPAPAAPSADGAYGGFAANAPADQPAKSAAAPATPPAQIALSGVASIRGRSSAASGPTPTTSEVTAEAAAPETSRARYGFAAAGQQLAERIAPKPPASSPTIAATTVEAPSLAATIRAPAPAEARAVEEGAARQSATRAAGVEVDLADADGQPLPAPRAGEPGGVAGGRPAVSGPTTRGFYADLNSNAPWGDASKPAPVLGDVPVLGELFRSEAGRASGRDDAVDAGGAVTLGQTPVTSHGVTVETVTNALFFAVTAKDGLREGQPRPNGRAEGKEWFFNAGQAGVDHFNAGWFDVAKAAVPGLQLTRRLEVDKRIKGDNVEDLDVVGYAMTPQERFQLGRPLEERRKAEIVLPKAAAEEAGLVKGSAVISQKKALGLDTKHLAMADTKVRRLSEAETVKAGKLEVQAKTAPLQQMLTEGIITDVTFAEDRPVRRPVTNAPIPQPEVQTRENAFSTFSLNVSDVSFKLAAASLDMGQMPDPASVRSEEFINAFDYRDPEPPPGAPIAFAWERARYPFAHNRDLLRFSLKTAAAGRPAGRPLNLVLLLDNSGSMERADRVQIIREALRVLAAQLQPQDKFSVVTFSRTPRLWVDGVSGEKAGEVAQQISGLTPQGGTNLEEAMNLAYATALRHYLATGINRVVLLTDGAANLGNVDPEALKQTVEAHRQQGVALDCFGIGWEGYNDDLLEILSRNGDGRYGFVNTPEEAGTDFAGQLAGALQVAASDVKVQVEFNPGRVTAYRQIGYAKHQLKKEQFRDNTVDAAEIAAQEAGNALYVAEVNPRGEGPLCIVRVRYKVPGTADYHEHEWAVPFTGNAVPLEQASPAMRLAASASAFSEWLVASPFAAEVTPDHLLGYLGGVPEIYGADARPKKLEWMIRQAKSLAGK